MGAPKGGQQLLFKHHTQKLATNAPQHFEPLNVR